MIGGVRLTESAARRLVPKWGMTREDLEFAFGSKDLVSRVIKAGWIEPINKRLGLYDSGDAAKAWARIKEEGEPAK